MPARRPVRTLTIFLLKREVTEDNALDSEITLQAYPIRIGTKEVGTLYARQTPILPPAWIKLFAGAVDRDVKLKNTSVAAVFLIRTGGRLFALAFGQGRHLLREGVCEERFGLRVTLNSVDPRFLRAVDVSTLESNPFHAKRQASRAAPLGQFGLNLDQDILRAVTGRPTDESRGSQMTGIDSLSVRVRVDLESLRALLKRYLEISEETGYQSTFPWVDHISEVRDATTKQMLFDRLVDLLNSQTVETAWAAIPEVIDWTTFDSFRIGSRGDDRPNDDITLEGLLAALRKDGITLEALRKKRVFCITNGNPHPTHTWSFLQCLTAELRIPAGLHILNASTWYRVSDDFVRQVDTDVDAIESSSSPLPTWGDERENEYNRRISRASRGSMALMDCVMISHAGMASPIEFCDLYTDDRRLIHVKRYGQSSILSHLFMQGMVSADCLLSDAKFRNALNEKLPATHVLTNPEDRPNPDNFEVAFAIGSNEMGPLRLPFFSRVTLKNVARSLKQSLGYRVTLSKIRIDKLHDISR
jgi:uncharacterized protein (TIGR04141 family)